MHECYAMQILETKRKHKNQRTMVTKGRAMKHKDHVRKTQLVRVFCIQNLLDAPRALEFLFTLEWFLTPGLEYRLRAFTNRSEEHTSELQSPC